MTEDRMKTPRAKDLLKTPYPHRTPEEQREDEKTKALDEKLKRYGTEGQEAGGDA